MSVLAGVLILAGGESTRMGRPKALLPVPNLVPNSAPNSARDSEQTLLEFHIRHALPVARTYDVPIWIADNGKGFTWRDDVLGDTVADTFDNTVNDRANDWQANICHSHDYLPNEHSESKGGQSKGAGALSAICGAMSALDLNDTSKYLLVLSCDSLVGADSLFDLLSNKRLDKTAPVLYVKSQNQSQDPTQTKALAQATTQKDYPLLGLYRCELFAKLCAYLERGERSVIKFLASVGAHSVPLPHDLQGLANFNTPDEFYQAVQVLNQVSAK